jgi:enoyl-CoA hydratase
MPTSSPDGRVELTRDEHVAVITMRRPAKRNALNFTMRQGLRDAFDEFERDPELRCAVLTGEGACFSAGGDLVEMTESRLEEVPAEWNQLLGSGPALTKPVVAAVNGPALAGGFRLAQDCDLCIAGESTLFGITEAKRGRGAPWAAPLTAMVPARIMMELLLTAEPITAQRAYDVGLVNKVVPDTDIVAEAVRTAHLIAANAPLSVAAGKRLVRLAADLGPLQAAEPAEWLYLRAYTSEDGQEGPRAFREKRAPVWKGR